MNYLFKHMFCERKRNVSITHAKRMFDRQKIDHYHFFLGGGGRILILSCLPLNNSNYC